MIRLMRTGDYDAVYALWCRCRGMGLNDLDDSHEGISRFLERNPDTCFVYEEAGSITGAILVGTDGRRAYIYHTAVDPEHRNKGIGTLLAKAALKAVEEMGINKAALVVFDRNEDGNRFWESRGFNKRDDIVYRDRALREMKRFDT